MADGDSMDCSNELETSGVDGAGCGLNSLGENDSGELDSSEKGVWESDVARHINKIVNDKDIADITASEQSADSEMVPEVGMEVSDQQNLSEIVVESPPDRPLTSDSAADVTAEPDCDPSIMEKPREDVAEVMETEEEEMPSCNAEITTNFENCEDVSLKLPDSNGQEDSDPASSKELVNDVKTVLSDDVLSENELDSSAYSTFQTERETVASPLEAEALPVTFVNSEKNDFSNEDSTTVEISKTSEDITVDGEDGCEPALEASRATPEPGTDSGLGISSEVNTEHDTDIAERCENAPRECEGMDTVEDMNTKKSTDPGPISAEFNKLASDRESAVVDGSVNHSESCESENNHPAVDNEQADFAAADAVDDGGAEESKINPKESPVLPAANVIEFCAEKSSAEIGAGDSEVVAERNEEPMEPENHASPHCLEMANSCQPRAEDNADGVSTEKAIDAETSDSKDSFSKLQIEMAEVSATDTDDEQLNRSAHGDSIKQDVAQDSATDCSTVSKEAEIFSTCVRKVDLDEHEDISVKAVGDSEKEISSKQEPGATETLIKASPADENVIELDEEVDSKEGLTALTPKVSEEASTKSTRGSTSSTPSTKGQQKTSKNANQSKTSKQQECIVCRKVAKCKYNIVRNDDTKHLCDDKCFQMFRTQPTIYLQAESKRTGSGETCAHCSKAIAPNTKGRNSLKLDKETKKFCSASCLNQFKKKMKPCASCGKDTRNSPNACTAPIEGENTKDFCGHACLVKYEHSRKVTAKFEDDDDDDDVEIVDTTPPPKPKGGPGRPLGSGKAKCSICTKNAVLRHDIGYKGQTYKLCSDACLSAFRIMHGLAMNQCETCHTSFNADGPQVQAIQFEGQSKNFCTPACLAAFKSKKQRIVPCTWCNTKKSNFDMVERLDANNKYQMFCSLNCLSLYRVNLQANSNQSVPCDQCKISAPAQYHLTMSDASVRNFCRYNCVIAFQAQFNQPSASSGQLPIPGNQVTANAANTQPATSAVPPTPRQSPYGTRHSSRAAKSAASPLPVQPTTMPVISNIMSLATAQPVSSASETGSCPKIVAHIGVQTIAAQEVVQPPPPKMVKNKALLCKPFLQTKATSCRPHMAAKSCQTEENWEPTKTIVPCPVPTVTPAPMTMYSHPVPYPILVPIPVPIPVFIPTTKKTTASIMKKIKELQERVPSDPFEAELLMMAEAVANANKTTFSGSESDDDDADGGGHIDSADTPAPVGSHPPPTNGELAEDMLQMALRMAEMQNEQTLDLEDAVDPTPIRAREPITMPVFDTIAPDNDVLQASHLMSTPRATNRGRGKRRGGSRGGRGSSVTKKPRIEEEPVETASTPASVTPNPVPPLDANCILKFTYGVNAYKHWAMQKNAQLERIPPPRAGMRQRLFKLDLLQCSADELNYALCLFVKEVRKPNGEEYAPDSIYYLCLGIQEYLYENGRIDNIFTDFFYEKFTECLNEILCHYEVRLNAQGMLVCRIEEEHLWESKQLGAHSPHVLLNTLIYFNTKHFMLRTPEDHLNLSFSHIMKHWKKTNTPSGKPGRSVYLRYYAPSQLGGDAAQKRKKEELPVFEQAENVDNPLRCPVKLYEFYLSKCPESIKNRSDVFYLVPERSCVPDSPVWYSTMSLSLEGMTRMLNRLRVVREIQESQLSLAVPYFN